MAAIRAAADLAGVVVELEKEIEKRRDPVRTRKNDPVVGVRVLHQLSERAEIARRLDPDRRQFGNVGAERTQFPTQHAGLLPGPRHDDPFSRERPRLIPVQLFSQRHNFAKDRDRRRLESGVLHSLRDVCREFPPRVSCRAGRRPTNQRNRQIVPNTCGEHPLCDRFDALHPHQHHLGAAKFRQRLKIDRAFRLLRIFVSGKKRDVRVLSAMRNRNSGISRPGDRRSNSRHDLERNSCLRERFRFLAPRPNTNGSPPFKRTT